MGPSSGRPKRMSGAPNSSSVLFMFALFHVLLSELPPVWCMCFIHIYLILHWAKIMSPSFVNFVYFSLGISHSHPRGKFFYTWFICPWQVRNWILSSTTSHLVTIQHKWHLPTPTLSSFWENLPSPSFAIPALLLPSPSHLGDSSSRTQSGIRTDN